MSERGKGVVDGVRKEVKGVVDEFGKQLGSKQTKVATKEGIFGVLRELTGFVEGIFNEREVGLLVPKVVEALEGKGGGGGVGGSGGGVQLKGIVLLFLRDLLHSHPTSYFVGYFEDICKVVCTILRDNHSKQVKKN